MTDDIKIRFFKAISGDFTINDFEQWVYQSDELKQALTKDSHFELMSFGYKQRGARYELIKILNKLIDLGEYETWKLKRLLDKVEKRTDDYIYSIMEFYDLYCHGYGFLDNLGLGYGLALECPFSKYGADSFDDLNDQEKEELINSFYPSIIQEVSKVRTWLDLKKIVLTGNINELGHYEYEDYRTLLEKEPTTYKRQRLDEKPLRKRWWEIWK